MVIFFYDFQGEVMQFWRGNIQQTVCSWAAMPCEMAALSSLRVMREIRSPQNLFKTYLHA